jgi:uncharacterized protein YjbI with pentapeptide repeats
VNYKHRAPNGAEDRHFEFSSDDNPPELMYKGKSEQNSNLLMLMPDSPTSEPESAFGCDCEEWMREACAGELFYKELEDKRYCVLHFPGKEKGADFEPALQRKLENKDFNFRGVWFPGNVSFSGCEIDTKGDFRSAIFNGEVSFRRTIFKEKVSFSDAEFGPGADFIGVRFRKQSTFNRVNFGRITSFSDAIFGEGVDFHNATFPEDAYFTHAAFDAEANFSGATFGGPALFNYATFSGSVLFAGSKQRRPFVGTSSLDFQFANIKRPNCVSFHGLRLRPHWFVKVNPSEFDFTNVNWYWRGADQEVESLTLKNLALPHGLLARACFRLADNAQENHNYEQASKFRYMAMETRRLESWRGFAPWRLSWWYWLASGYGERVWQAFFVLLGILLLSALFYNHVGFAQWEPKVASETDLVVSRQDDTGAPLKFSRALTYSAAVMTFQKPEPRPATTAAQTVVLLETILGPVQAALLALAIRRKFMR